MALGGPVHGQLLGVTTFTNTGIIDLQANPLPGDVLLISGGSTPGVNGAYFFDSDGQSGLAYPDTVVDPSLGQAHLVLQIQNGRHHVLSPIPYVEARFRQPPWCA